MPDRLDLLPEIPRKLAYTYAEAKQLISASRNVWQALIASGQIRPIRDHKLVSHDELERYLRDNTGRRRTKDNNNGQ